MVHIVKKGTDEDFLVEEPSASYGYSYADYLGWRLQERIEIFRGRIFKLSAPNRVHQQISSHLHVMIGSMLKNKQCRIFSAPFDVRLPFQNQKKDHEVTTVVQPDLCVVCDSKKLDERGCYGAPDLVIEILSPGNNKKEVSYKYELYEEAGVDEYWIVYPYEQNIIVYTLNENQKYVGGKIYASGDVIFSSAVKGLKVEITGIFED